MGIALAGGSSLGVAMGPQTRQRTVDVTSSATITSSDAAVVEAVGSRLKALSAGSAVITASFDALSGTEQVVVVASVEDPLTTMELSASLSPAGAGSSTPTLNLVQGGTTQGSLRLGFASGLVWSDVSAKDWLTVADVASFSSSHASAVAVDTLALLTQHNNQMNEVSVDTQSHDWASHGPCPSGACAVLQHALPMWSNLRAAAGDADLGARYGLQFVQEASGLRRLQVGIAATTQSGHNLIGFEITVEPEAGYLSSSGAEYIEASWPGVSTALDLPPYKAVATNLDSSLDGYVALGEMRLAVTQGGVVLITGRMLSLVTCQQGLDCGQPDNTVDAPGDIVAGEGYAALSTSRRARRLSEPPTAEARAAAVPARRQRRRHR